MQGAAGALRGRGEDLSIALASLDSFAAEADKALRILDSQEQAVTGLVSGGAEVFGALSERQGQLSGLIRNTEAVFSTTAQRNEDLKDAVHRPADLPARVAGDARPRSTSFAADWPTR